MRWLKDSDLYNEWMNPQDYETEEFQAEQDLLLEEEIMKVGWLRQHFSSSPMKLHCTPRVMLKRNEKIEKQPIHMLLCMLYP
jgi:hypothetical protein